MSTTSLDARTEEEFSKSAVLLADTLALVERILRKRRLSEATIEDVLYLYAKRLLGLTK
jgi:hypothetical protein